MPRVRRSSPRRRIRGLRGATSPISPPTWSSTWRPPGRATPSSCSVRRRVHPRAPRSWVRHIGPGSITDSGPLLPGTYIYTAQQIDQSNTVSLPSAPLNVTIVTTGDDPDPRPARPELGFGDQGGQRHQRHREPGLRRFWHLGGHDRTAVQEQLASQLSSPPPPRRQRRRSAQRYGLRDHGRSQLPAAPVTCSRPRSRSRAVPAAAARQPYGRP